MSINSIQNNLELAALFHHLGEYDECDEAFDNKILKRIEGLSLLEVINVIGSGAIAATQVILAQNPFLPFKTTRLKQEQYDTLINPTSNQQPEYGKSKEFNTLFDSARRAYILYCIAMDIKDKMEAREIKVVFKRTLEEIRQIILDAFEDCLLEEIGPKQVKLWIQTMLKLGIKDNWKKQAWWLEVVYEETCLETIMESLDDEKRKILMRLPLDIDSELNNLLGQFYAVDPKIVENIVEDLSRGYTLEQSNASGNFALSLKSKAYNNLLTGEVLTFIKEVLLGQVVVNANPSCRTIEEN